MWPPLYAEQFFEPVLRCNIEKDSLLEDDKRQGHNEDKAIQNSKTPSSSGFSNWPTESPIPEKLLRTLLFLSDTTGLIFNYQNLFRYLGSTIELVSPESTGDADNLHNVPGAEEFNLNCTEQLMKHAFSSATVTLKPAGRGVKACSNRFVKVCEKKRNTQVQPPVFSAVYEVGSEMPSQWWVSATPWTSCFLVIPLLKLAKTKVLKACPNNFKFWRVGQWHESE